MADTHVRVSQVVFSLHEYATTDENGNLAMVKACGSVLVNGEVFCHYTTEDKALAYAVALLDRGFVQDEDSGKYIVLSKHETHIGDVETTVRMWFNMPFPPERYPTINPWVPVLLP